MIDTEEQEMEDSLNETLYGKQVPFQGQEAPYSVTVQGYYKGYSILSTVRHPNAKAQPFLEQAVKMINWMEDNGFNPSWNDTTNKQVKSQDAHDVSGEVAKMCTEHNVQMLSGWSKKKERSYWYHDNAAGERCFGRGYLPART